MLFGSSLILRCLKGQGPLVGVGERRLYHRPRPKVPAENTVDFGGIDADLSPEVDPGQETENDPEEPVDSAVIAEIVSDQIAAQRQQDGPGNTADHCTGNEFLRGDRLRSKDPEGKEVLTEIDEDGQELADKTQQDVVTTERTEGGQKGRHGQSGTEDDEKKQAPSESFDEVGPFGAGQVPHLAHGKQSSLRESGASPDET